MSMVTKPDREVEQGASLHKVRRRFDQVVL